MTAPLVHGVQRVAAQLEQLWAEDDLLAAAAVVESDWIDTSRYHELVYMRSHTGGAHLLEVAWSRDGVTADFVGRELWAPPTSPGGSRVPVMGRFARFRVTNTGGTAFTAHKTVVQGR